MDDPYTVFLRDEVKSLRRELSELRARLESLELSGLGGEESVPPVVPAIVAGPGMHVDDTGCRVVVSSAPVDRGPFAPFDVDATAGGFMIKRGVVHVDGLEAEDESQLELVQREDGDWYVVQSAAELWLHVYYYTESVSYGFAVDDESGTYAPSGAVAVWNARITESDGSSMWSVFHGGIVVPHPRLDSMREGGNPKNSSLERDEGGRIQLFDFAESAGDWPDDPSGYAVVMRHFDEEDDVFRLEYKDLSSFIPPTGPTGPADDLSQDEVDHIHDFFDPSECRTGHTGDPVMWDPCQEEVVHAVDWADSRYWPQGGDNTACWGRSIGDGGGAIAIHLDNHALQGTWSIGQLVLGSDYVRVETIQVFDPDSGTYVSHNFLTVQ